MNFLPLALHLDEALGHFSRREVDKAIDSMIRARQIEMGAIIGEAEADAIKRVGRSAIRQQVIRRAVKKKAERALGSTN